MKAVKMDSEAINTLAPKSKIEQLEFKRENKASCGLNQTADTITLTPNTWRQHCWEAEGLGVSQAEPIG